MAKHRIRLKSGKKGRQRWAKGQSGASNPSQTKFRDAAKARLLRGQGFSKPAPSIQETLEANGHHAFDGNITGREFPTKLTAECLLRHEAVLGQIDSLTGGSTGISH